MISKLFNSFIFLIAVLFLLAILSAVWIFVPVDTVEPIEKIVTIPYGYNSSQIRMLLEKENIIRPFDALFQVMTKLTGMDEQLKSGEYRFQSSQNLIQIIDQLVKGRVVRYRVTIPEGYQSRQIARLLEDREIVSFDEFLQFLQENNDYQEGYLFPDTYEFPKNYGVPNVLESMKKNFEETVFPQVNPDQEFPTGLDFHQVIILASIIEKEALGAEDKPRIASVFYNRLNQGMRLQSCATVQYLLEKPQERLTQADLEIESPFNTYLHAGLPPAPICNPGLESILAAANPAQEDYLYFVLGKDGEHIFSRTYQEHLENKP